MSAVDGWETVVGLEVHVQLQTRSKLFCGCSARYAGASPNVHVCPTCLGLPGALPVVNAEAVRMAVRVGLAIGCRIDEGSVFARKNYFYPDLPKGYQISQFELPIDVGGALALGDEGSARRVNLERIHLEEDAAKTGTAPDGRTRVDFNRAGVPLLEIVSRPELRGGEEAEAYLRRLRELLLHLRVNDGNLEEGSFRCDANVSIRRPGEPLGTRVELKNLNSIRFVRLAVEHEVGRQRRTLETGGEIVQETRGWAEDEGASVSLRSKEEAMDYRYFPDPDLPPLLLPPGLVDAEATALPRLPWTRRREWVETRGLSSDDARTLAAHPELARAFEAACETVEETLRTSGVASPGPAAVGKRVANFLQAEVLRYVQLDGLRAEFPVDPDRVGRLLALVVGGTLTGKLAKRVFEEMRRSGAEPAAIVDRLGLRPLDDPEALGGVVAEVVSAHPKQVRDFRGGKDKLFGFFVGQVMKATSGRADPKTLDGVLRRALAAPPAPASSEDPS